MTDLWLEIIGRNRYMYFVLGQCVGLMVSCSFLLFLILFFFLSSLQHSTFHQYNNTKKTTSTLTVWKMNNKISHKLKDAWILFSLICGLVPWSWYEVFLWSKECTIHNAVHTHYSEHNEQSLLICKFKEWSHSAVYHVTFPAATAGLMDYHKLLTLQGRGRLKG